MSRLIDVDKYINGLLGELEKHKDDKGVMDDAVRAIYEVFIEDAQRQPTVDAVEVVRCKDCEHCYKDSFGELRCDCNYGSFNMDKEVLPDYFCYDGEPKEVSE